MDCPICGLANVSTALQCDCGYDFRNRTGGQQSVLRAKWLDREGLAIVGWTCVAFGLALVPLVGLAAGLVMALGGGMIVACKRRRRVSDEGRIRRDSRQQ